MDKKKISFILILFALSISIFLLGCKVDKIQFNRESQAQKFMNNFSNESKSQAKSSSGIIILRTQSKNNTNNYQFGPKFDLPSKF
ncbi:hypothetical protein IJ425_04010 [bacterium]|nr:hypothetical protein [bacterium]